MSLRRQQHWEIWPQTHLHQRLSLRWPEARKRKAAFLQRAGNLTVPYRSCRSPASRGQTLQRYFRPSQINVHFPEMEGKIWLKGQ